MNKSYQGSIALTKLQHVKFKSPKGADCLMIPIDLNLLEKDGDGNIYLPISVLIKPKQDKNGQDGYVFKKIGSESYKAADDAQKEEWNEKDNPDTTILGSVKHFAKNTNDSSGAMSNETIDNEDDLPF